MKCLHVGCLCLLIFGLLSSTAHAEVIPGKSLYVEVDNKDHSEIFELSSDMSKMEVFPDNASTRDFTIVIKAHRMCLTKSISVSRGDSMITIACNTSDDSGASSQQLPGVLMPNVIPGTPFDNAVPTVVHDFELLNAR